MNANEVTVFAVLIGIGILSGALCGCLAVKRGKDFTWGLILTLLAAILIPLAILFLMSLYEESLRSERRRDSRNPYVVALAMTFLVGVGSSMTSGLSGWISYWLVFRLKTTRASDGGRLNEVDRR